MFDFLAPIHRSLGWMMPFETALVACGVLTLTILYLAISEVQRFGRRPMIICTSVGLALMAVLAVILKLYDNELAIQAHSVDVSAATFSQLNVVTAAVAVLVITATGTQIVVQTWRESNRPTRITLALGLVTLVSATLSVLTGCISYRFAPGTQPWIVFTEAKIYLRDITFVAGIVFGVALISFVGHVITTIAAGSRRSPVTSNGGGSEM